MNFLEQKILYCNTEQRTNHILVKGIYISLKFLTRA